MPSRSKPSAATAGELGTLLRAARIREALSLSAVAKLAGTSASHLSRIERGERDALSRDLLARLASTLRADPGEVFAAAGLLPLQIERELASPALALALVDGAQLPYRTRWMLRRRHLGILAERAGAARPGGRVDIGALLRSRGYAVELLEAPDRTLRITPETVTVVADPVDLQRLLLAHAVAHTMLDEAVTCHLDDPECTPEDEDREAEATALGSFILVPAAPLALAVRDAAADFDVWGGQLGAFLDSLAARFGAPAWVVARRVSEEGFFVDAAQLVDM
jgi:transcriptional regulator with XRE-family HTH domain